MTLFGLINTLDMCQPRSDLLCKMRFIELKHGLPELQPDGILNRVKR